MVTEKMAEMSTLLWQFLLLDLQVKCPGASLGGLLLALGVFLWGGVVF